LAVFTSNVAGQFQKAGFDPDAVDEYHGSLHHLQCLGPSLHRPALQTGHWASIISCIFASGSRPKPLSASRTRRALRVTVMPTTTRPVAPRVQDQLKAEKGAPRSLTSLGKGGFNPSMQRFGRVYLPVFCNPASFEVGH